MKPMIIIIVLSLFGFFQAFHAFAQEEEDGDAAPVLPVPRDVKGAVSLQIENDFFGDGSDRGYTNGVRLSHVFSENNKPDIARWLQEAMPFVDDDAPMRSMLALGQNIYTPEDITVSALIPDDRPYAGWLYLELGLSVQKPRYRDSVMVSLGVIGPASLAEQAQRKWHKVIGSDIPQGWDNQLSNEPALMFLFEREWRGAQAEIGNGLLEFDLKPRLGAVVGNVFTYGSTGLMFRVGHDIRGDYGAPRIQPSLPGSAMFTLQHGFGWYFFAGAEVRLIARNIFLDGNTFTDSHSVDKKHVVRDLQAGFAMTFGRSFPVRITYSFVARSKEFVGQTQSNAFGSVSLSVQF